MTIKNAYKTEREKKILTLAVRIDSSMAYKLIEISEKTGVTISELIREGVRRVISSVEENEKFEMFE